MLKNIGLILSIIIFGITLFAVDSTARNAEDAYFRGNHFWSLKDYRNAIKWYSRASKAGYGAASYKVGMMHSRGLGTAVNSQTAVRWYKKAASQRYHPAMYQLGVVYASGRGIGQDSVQAYMWFGLAERMGNKIAHARMDALEKNMDKRDIVKSLKLIEESFGKP